MSLSTIRVSRPGAHRRVELEGVEDRARRRRLVGQRGQELLLVLRAVQVAAREARTGCRTKASACSPFEGLLARLEVGAGLLVLDVLAGCPSRRRRPRPRCWRSRRSRSPRSGRCAGRCCTRRCGPAARGPSSAYAAFSLVCRPVPGYVLPDSEPLNDGISTSESRGSEISVGPLLADVQDHHRVGALALGGAGVQLLLLLGGHALAAVRADDQVVGAVARRRAGR